MTLSVAAAVGLLLFAWAAVSGLLGRRSITGPLIFAVAGYVLANPDWGPLPADVETGLVHGLTEITLALVLFADAARVKIGELRRDAAVPGRLLGIGLPLCLLVGTLLAATLLDLPFALALLVGAALAPTDAALSGPIIADARVDLRLRRALNVESGLNDGLATPFVTVALALAAGQLGPAHETTAFELGTALSEVGRGVVVGVLAGLGGALVLNVAARRDWIAPEGRSIAGLALAATAFALAVSLGANGFIAAFVAGIAFGSRVEEADQDGERPVELLELSGELLALVVWFLFGATLLPLAVEHFAPVALVYALVSLVVVRGMSVALALVASGLDRPSRVFLAWFGPRGLASVVFALIAIEQLGAGDASVDLAVATVTLTVGLSVLLHGLTAVPGGRLYVHAELPPGPGDGPRPRRSRLSLAHRVVTGASGANERGRRPTEG